MAIFSESGVISVALSLWQGEQIDFQAARLSNEAEISKTRCGYSVICVPKGLNFTTEIAIYPDSVWLASPLLAPAPPT